MNRNICGYQRCNKFSIIVWSILFLFILVKCSQANSTPIGITPTPTVSAMTPTYTPTIRASITPLPSWTPSWTPPPPPPTYSPNEVDELIIDLLETNAGCLLPCYWGWTPGETSWDDVINFFLPFSLQNIDGQSANNGVFGVVINVRENISPDNFYNLKFNIKNNIVVALHAEIELDNFIHQEVLSEYGQPDEIWIRTYPSNTPGGDIPFIFILFYSNEGIFASYETLGTIVGENIRACPHRAVGSTMGVWVHGEELTFEEASDRVVLLGKGVSDFRKLEDVTNLTVENFYLRYQTLGIQQCLETLADNWSQ